MAKGKFRFIFANGKTMIGSNLQFKTKARAKKWAKDSNKVETKKKWKIVDVKDIKHQRKQQRITSRGFSGFGSVRPFGINLK